MVGRWSGVAILLRVPGSDLTSDVGGNVDDTYPISAALLTIGHRSPTRQGALGGVIGPGLGEQPVDLDRSDLHRRVAAGRLPRIELILYVPRSKLGHVRRCPERDRIGDRFTAAHLEDQVRGEGGQAIEGRTGRPNIAENHDEARHAALSRNRTEETRRCGNSSAHRSTPVTVPLSTGLIRLRLPRRISRKAPRKRRPGARMSVRPVASHPTAPDGAAGISPAAGNRRS
ncbi:hypothetical protein QE361_002463 [Sphingomonas sp. SORGH_AS802]|nr:hypothetical protein [Sphingomonas sp. SORGH_AS_0438]MDR6135468.1 hypothetical protein [Sphingomonas sp. SORGH_AS_0802]